MGVIMAVSGAVSALGLFLIVMGMRRLPDQRKESRATVRFKRLSWKSPMVQLLFTILLGAVIGLVTGWMIVLVILPAAVLGLPYLVGRSTSATTIERLEAMEEWTRSLAGILSAGTGIEQGLVGTLRSTPPAIRMEVSSLVARLRARWSTSDAIRAFADDLKDPTGDIIAANLLLGVARRGTGLASILEGLAESVSLDIRARRQAEADQAKPRATARWVTIITAVVLGALFVTGTYMDAYKTGFGQVVLLGLLSLYSAILVWMKRIAAGPRPRRLLIDEGGLT